MKVLSIHFRSEDFYGFLGNSGRGVCLCGESWKICEGGALVKEEASLIIHSQDTVNQGGIRSYESRNIIVGNREE